PGDRLVVLLPGWQMDGLNEPTAGLQLLRSELLKLGCRIGVPEFRADGPLHVGGHGLQRLLAEFRKAASLVDNASSLAPHSQGACLAGILGAHGLPEPP